LYFQIEDIKYVYPTIFLYLFGLKIKLKVKVYI
jgi:hypothetical protein